jgi:hypothetical protein
LLLAVEATLTVLVFLECPRILGSWGLVGEVQGEGLTWPSAVLLSPDAGAIARLGRVAAAAADVLVMGCAAAASWESCDNCTRCPSGFVPCDEKPSEVEVGGVETSGPSAVDCDWSLQVDCRPSVGLLASSRLSPAAVEAEAGAARRSGGGCCEGWSVVTGEALSAMSTPVAT